MFKIDFFEFYVLLERALIHLLAVFGITVSALSHQQAQDSDTDVPPNQTYTNGQHIIGDARIFNHSFHANVLQALDQPTNPLHSILGSGDVRSYIGIAKEFRNRWKDAEERPASPSAATENLGGLRRYQHLLHDLKLEAMLSSIMSALHAAAELADRTSVIDGLDAAETDRMEVNTDDAPWEAMPDAMDWD